MNDFIKEVSYLNIWIACFAIWKEQYTILVKDFDEQNHTLVSQNYVFCDLISKGNKVCILNEKIFELITDNKKGRYNIAEIFGEKYLGILKEFVKMKKISKKIYYKEKKLILKKHINVFYFDLNKISSYKKTGYFKFLLKDYWYKYYIKIQFENLYDKLKGVC